MRHEPPRLCEAASAVAELPRERPLAPLPAQYEFTMVMELLRQGHPDPKRKVCGAPLPATPIH